MGVVWCYGVYSLASLWTVWKERNDKIYRDEVVPSDERLNRVFLQIGKCPLLEKILEFEVSFLEKWGHVWSVASHRRATRKGGSRLLWIH